MPKHRPTKKARTSSTSTKAKKSSVLPTDHDPEDTSFCMSLYSQEDEGNVNPVHNKIRKEVIQIKRTESGRVYFQCGSCSHLPRSDRVKISTIAPTSVACIYRAFGRFIKHHVPDCPHIPKRLKVLDPKKVTGWVFLLLVSYIIYVYFMYCIKSILSNSHILCLSSYD